MAHGISPTDVPVQAPGYDAESGEGRSPILCSPFTEPSAHWRFDRATGRAVETAGRRQAGYYPETESGETVGQLTLLDQPEQNVLPLVNRLREDVKRWRESGYRGASTVTRELLTHWWRKDRLRRLFFCQLEAVETIIYLAEMRLTGRSGRTGFKKFEVPDEAIERMLKGERPDFPEYIAPDYYPTLVDKPIGESLRPLVRLGCKMATGSGKTVVMAMLISWAFCNRGRNPQSAQYPNAVLICCPNLTVRDRLQVLRPEMQDSYYDQFDIVPAKYRPLLNKGKVLVTNWHCFAPESAHKEGDATYKVVDKGEESADVFARRVLGDLHGRLPIMVLNDEGHHAWRPAPADEVDTKTLTAEEKKRLEDEKQEATIWVQGLDKINNAAGGASGGERGILFNVDLSATPFYIAGSGHPEGRPFPWLVSDFGLVDAIESGIVKVPRLPVRDETGRPEPKYYKLWEHICKHPPLKAAEKVPGKSGKPRPEVAYRKAQDALLQIAGEWKEMYQTLIEEAPGEDRVPPVLIVVCDNTDIAEEFYRRISGERQVEYEGDKGKTQTRTEYGHGEVFPDYLANTDTEKRTIRIDSKLLAEAESALPGRTKQDAAQELRRIVATVGDKGEPGEKVRCVVSVSMLTEGWDANNVTHVLGIRAFGSQLLCEQVVGRGLRRMSYEVDERDRLQPEYVDVYGIPFSMIPFEGKTSRTQVDRPTVRVMAMKERAGFELRFPVVEGYAYALTSAGIRCDVSQVERLEIEPNTNPRSSYISPGISLGPDAGPDMGAFGYDEQDREPYYTSTHLQAIEFAIARLVTERLVESGLMTGNGKHDSKRLQARHQLFPQVFRIVKQYVETRVTWLDSNRCELGLETYVKRTVDRLADAIRPVDEQEVSTLMPVLNRYKPIGTTADVNFLTRRPIQPVQKSHISHVVADTVAWEQSAAFQLDRPGPKSPVVCFARNDHMDLLVPYEYDGVERTYEPDYLVKLTNGVNLILEVKGQFIDETHAKHEAAKRWVEAVNNWGRLGRWAFHVCKNPLELRGELDRLAAKRKG